MKIKRILLCLLTSISLKILAQPFDSCPSEAYLFQGNPVSVFGVDLVTGTYSLLQDNAGMEGNINSVGFDNIDRYLYGFNTTTLEVVKMDYNFQATVLPVTGLPEGKFFVGDVYQHHYYFYKKSSGLYRINLDESTQNYLQVQTISQPGAIGITDFAFHPADGKIYAVENSTGFLYRMDPVTGNTEYLGEAGQTGTFGAAYFDVSGFLYISRNQDGHIFRIDISNLDDIVPTAYLFALGPLSSLNDGARCATAPLITSNVDFSDAPKSYATTLANNGARHAIVEGAPFLGYIAPDGDGEGWQSPLSDDNTQSDDEDGVGFVTAIETGIDVIIAVTASAPGYLNAWIDWNADGDFLDSGEQIANDFSLTGGLNSLSVLVPTDANIGQSWSRFRISSQGGLRFDGGAPDGEVEDHPINITASGLVYQYYPGENSWSTLAYEDHWPAAADFDMNDVVFHYRTRNVFNYGLLQRVDIYGELTAMGADYYNGFAIQLPGIDPSMVSEAGLRLYHNGILQPDFTLEANEDYAVITIEADLTSKVTNTCDYYRTDSDCLQPIEFSFEVNIPFNQGLSTNLANPLYDPFIFSTPHYYHGEYLYHPGSAWQVHLADMSPTNSFNSYYWQLDEDTSDESNQRYYRNINNLPWAMEIAGDWKHPQSGVRMLDAYPRFKRFIQSNGTEFPDWYNQEHRNENLLY